MGLIPYNLLTVTHMWDYPRVMLIKRWLYYQGDRKLETGQDRLSKDAVKFRVACSVPVFLDQTMVKLQVPTLLVNKHLLLSGSPTDIRRLLE